MPLHILALFVFLGVLSFLFLDIALAFRSFFEKRHTWFFFLASNMSQILLAISILAFCFYPSQPRINLPRTVELALGALLFVAGMAVETKGSLDLGVRRSMGGVCGEQLVVRGIYRVVRHPQNLGGMMWITGVAFLADSLYLLIVSLLLWIPLFIIESYLEDRDLRRKFGENFEKYAREVPMFIPRLWRKRA